MSSEPRHDGHTCPYTLANLSLEEDCNIPEVLVSIRTLRTALHHPVPDRCPAHCMSLDVIIQTKSGASTNHKFLVTFFPSVSRHLLRPPSKYSQSILSKTPANVSKMSISRHNFSVSIMQHLLSACVSPIATQLASPSQCQLHSSTSLLQLLFAKFSVADAPNIG
jgi:hypothetical protein